MSSPSCTVPFLPSFINTSPDYTIGFVLQLLLPYYGLKVIVALFDTPFGISGCAVATRARGHIAARFIALTGGWPIALTPSPAFDLHPCASVFGYPQFQFAGETAPQGRAVPARTTRSPR